MKDKRKQNEFLNNLKYAIINIIVFIFVLVCIFYKPDVSIEAPGGLINIGDRLSNVVYKSKGSFNLTYVTSYRGNLVTVLLGKILPDWDIVKNSEISDLDYDSLVKSQTISLYSSISNATYNAYTEAGIEPKIKSKNYYIYYVLDEIAETDLKIGDKILKYDDNDYDDFYEFKKYLNKKEVGDSITFKVIRDKKEIEVIAKVKEEQGVKVIGIVVYTIFEYENDPDIHYAYKESEIGSSGGLMLSLTIYNALVENDITKGKKISGTGTIELDGTVGEIAGIKYKILGAVKDKADVFIVPANNYEEAEKIVKERKLKIKLIKAENFKQVLEELSNM